MQDYNANSILPDPKGPDMGGNLLDTELVRGHMTDSFYYYNSLLFSLLKESGPQHPPL